MPLVRDSRLRRLGAMSRRVSAGLLSRFWPGGDEEVEARIAALSPSRQAAIVGAILGLLLLSALAAAQFGWPGLLLYGIAVVVLVG